ncbi:MAG: hypothetical protein HC812_13720 [Leptolyngbya sp. RL_3_1]|nr:hypothetical protein [Leptolyngbya sp. RL_3_1]
MGKKKDKTPKVPVNQQSPGQDPKKVDTLMGGAILLAAGLVVGAIAFMNVGPYRDLIYSALTEWGWLSWLYTIPVIGQWLDSAAILLAIIVGAALFAGIQLGEIWPLVSAEKTTKDRKWGRKMLFLVALACCCYALDAVACSFFWPPLKVDFQQFRWAALLSDIAWGNLFVTLVTLFGLSGYVWLWRQIARVM